MLKNYFTAGIVLLIVIRVLLVILLMNNIPFTDMQLGGFRPHYSGSYWPDEVHYFQLGQSLKNFSPVANVSNLGYPLFLAPIIYLTGADDVIGITKPVFVIQAFLFFSLAIILVALTAFEIFKKRRPAIAAAALFTFYPYLLLGILKLAHFPRWIPAFHYQMWITIGADYLSAVLLYLGFYLFIKKFNSGNFNSGWTLVLGAVFAAAALVRVANILYLPLIFLILLWLKKYHQSLNFALSAFLVYLPQWIYNIYFFGSPLTYGYRINALSGFGSQTKIFGDWFSFGNVLLSLRQIHTYLPGFLFFSPILILILGAGFWRLFRRQKILAYLLAFWILLNVLFYVFFIAASSQLRYFVPSIPPLIILLFEGIAEVIELFKEHGSK